jgi:hypothetical protein
MRLSYEDIINKHKGGKCIVIGHGPSLNKYLGELTRLREEGYVLIGCNNWYEFYPNEVPEYWINANTVDHSRNLADYINKYKSIWIYADTLDNVPYEWVEKNLDVDYFSFDQRHFGGKQCYCCKNGRCIVHFDPNRLTLQETLQNYTGYNKHYSSGHTVAIHMLAFAILFGFSEINLVGLDFNYNIGYANNNTNRTSGEPNFFDIYGPAILDDFILVGDSVKDLGVEINNLNLDSHWDIFPLKTI